MKQKLQKLTGIIFLAGIVLLSLSVMRNYVRLQRAKATINEARVKLQKMQTEENELNDQIARAESTEFIEKQLRDKLGMAKEGEVVLVLPDEGEIKKLAPPRREEEEYEQKSNWEKWKELFF